MATIAVGGLHHETNTFAAQPATFEMFVQADGWPPLCRGAGLEPAVAGINLPITGFIEAARGRGHALKPLVWANACPSGPVTLDAYERLTAMMLDDLAAAEPFDAVFLDLHGAMVAEHLPDGEGELLRRVRARVGARRPVVAALDLHANVSDAMVAHADLLIGYRTYPHVDLALTGARCARRLDRLLRDGTRPAKAHRKPPFLVPLTAQCTMSEPAAGLYRRLEELERTRGADLSLLMGFPAADTPECGPSVLAYAADPATAGACAADLALAVEAREAEFAGGIWPLDEAVRHAMRADAGRPVILADTQDNPGGGGSGDTTGLLEALVRHGAVGAVLAPFHDPEGALRAHAAGEGARLRLALGGRNGPPGVVPFEAEFAVERLGDGRFVATGPVYGGNRMDLGPMALLRVIGRAGAVRVIVASRRIQAADQAILRHLGVEPAAERILALKSSVHFRADFEPIAAEVLVVEAPGAVVADPARLPFRRLRPGLRTAPRVGTAPPAA